jgi:hypothetical protein
MGPRRRYKMRHSRPHLWREAYAPERSQNTTCLKKENPHQRSPYTSPCQGRKRNALVKEGPSTGDLYISRLVGRKISKESSSTPVAVRRVRQHIYPSIEREHSELRKYLGPETTTPRSPPPYQEHIHTAGLPRKDQLIIISIIDSIMVQVVEDLAALHDESANPLGTSGLIRESCTESAMAIVMALLPQMTEYKATEVIEEVNQNFHRIGRALADITPTSQKVAVCTIWVDAVKNAVQNAVQTAAAKNPGPRVNGWVFALSAMANSAACNIMMEVHYF